MTCEQWLVPFPISNLMSLYIFILCKYNPNLIANKLGSLSGGERFSYVYLSLQKPMFGWWLKVQKSVITLKLCHCITICLRIIVMMTTKLRTKFTLMSRYDTYYLNSWTWMLNARWVPPILTLRTVRQLPGSDSRCSDTIWKRICAVW